MLLLTLQMVLKLGIDTALVMLTKEEEGDIPLGVSDSSVNLGDLIPAGLKIQSMSISALGSGIVTFFSSTVSSRIHSDPPAIKKFKRIFLFNDNLTAKRTNEKKNPLAIKHLMSEKVPNLWIHTHKWPPTYSKAFPLDC